MLTDVHFRTISDVSHSSEVYNGVLTINKNIQWYFKVEGIAYPQDSIFWNVCSGWTSECILASLSVYMVHAKESSAKGMCVFFFWGEQAEMRR